MASECVSSARRGGKGQSIPTQPEAKLFNHLHQFREIGVGISKADSFRRINMQ
jgi:hypothetical protein